MPVLSRILVEFRPTRELQRLTLELMLDANIGLDHLVVPSASGKYRPYLLHLPAGVDPHMMPLRLRYAPLARTIFILILSERAPLHPRKCLENATDRRWNWCHRLFVNTRLIKYSGKRVGIGISIARRPELLFIVFPLEGEAGGNPIL